MKAVEFRGTHRIAQCYSISHWKLQPVGLDWHCGVTKAARTSRGGPFLIVDGSELQPQGAVMQVHQPCRYYLSWGCGMTHSARIWQMPSKSSDFATYSVRAPPVCRPISEAALFASGNQPPPIFTPAAAVVSGLHRVPCNNQHSTKTSTAS